MVLTADRKSEIQGRAREVLIESYRDLAEDGADPHLFLRSRLKDIVVQHAGVQIVEAPEIHIREDASAVVWVGGEVAGMLERDKSRMTIATKHALTSQRFTTAHELGHWYLHEGIVFFRERPMFDTAFANLKKPLPEREADTFAAELLMPGKLVTASFREICGDPISLEEISPEELFEISQRFFVSQRFLEFKQRGVRNLAFFIARMNVIGVTTRVQPLHERFGVSPEAMAIRLEELGLVRE